MRSIVQTEFTST